MVRWMPVLAGVDASPCQPQQLVDLRYDLHAAGNRQFLWTEHGKPLLHIDDQKCHGLQREWLHRDTMDWERLRQRVFAKAGAAHIHSTTSGSAPVPSLICCVTSPFQLDRTNTSFAAGVGAQLKFGPLSARAEYERFSAAGENPYLLSLGLTWSFF